MSSINDIFITVGSFARSVLESFLPGWLADILLTLVTILFFLGILVLIVMSLVYLERRVIALMQDRLGPNRVGPQGSSRPWPTS